MLLKAVIFTSASKLKLLAHTPPEVGAQARQRDEV